MTLECTHIGNLKRCTKAGYRLKGVNYLVKIKQKNVRTLLVKYAEPKCETQLFLGEMILCLNAYFTSPAVFRAPVFCNRFLR